MKLKKFIVVISLPLFLSSLLLSQNLVELARKEKERRARLRGLTTVVVTNADLGKVRKRPALRITRIAAPASTAASPQGTSEMDKSEPTRTPSPAQQDPNIDRREPGQQPSVEELEANYYKTKEYTQLLTIKLRGLWQEFYSMDDMSDRGGLQKQIAETSLQIEKSQRDEAIAKKAMETGRTQVRRKKP